MPSRIFSGVSCARRVEPRLPLHDGDAPVRRTELRAGDPQHLAVEDLRLAEPAQPLHRQGEVVERRDDVGVLAAEDLLLDGQAPPQQRLGLPVLPLLDQGLRQTRLDPVELRVPVAQDPAVELQALPPQALGGGVIAEPVLALGHAEDALRHDRPHRALDLAGNGKGLAVERLGLCVAHPQGEDLRQLVERLRHLEVALAQEAAPELERPAQVRLGAGQVRALRLEQGQVLQALGDLQRVGAEGPVAQLQGLLEERCCLVVTAEAEGHLADGVHQCRLHVRLSGQLPRHALGPSVQDLPGRQSLAPRVVGIGLLEGVDQEGEGVAGLVALPGHAPPLDDEARQNPIPNRTTRAAATTETRLRRTNFPAR